jgi:hypothetical protein
MDALVLLLPILVIVAVVVLVVLIFVYQRKKEKERTQQLQLTAGQLGWSFTPETTLSMIPGFERFALFNQGHTKTIKNMMYGEANGIKAAVFDYVYVTGYGKHRRTHAQSVAYLEPGNLSIPYFSLRPESTVLKIFAAFGYQDIDFGQRPAFSSQYLLRGSDEQAIRGTFNDGLLSLYEANPGTCTDGGGNQLLIYREGYRWEAQEIQPFVGFSLSVLNLLPRYR